MALLPKEFLKSVFSIDKMEGADFKCIGTGFMYFKVIEDLGSGKYSGESYLVTANHVLFNSKKELKDQIQEVFLRFDTLGGENTHYFRVELYNEKGAVFSSPLTSTDVAVIKINSQDLINQKIDFIQIFDSSSLYQKDYDDKGLSNGDEVFFLGFPLGLRGDIRNYAICRGGMIARLDDETLEKNIIYLDAPVFPGNSGGPVFCKPQLAHIEGTKNIDRAYLLGIATKYIYKEEVVDSSIPEGDLKKLEGHLGLAKIVTVDAIDKAIEEHKRRFS